MADDQEEEIDQASQYRGWLQPFYADEHRSQDYLVQINPSAFNLEDGMQTGGKHLYCNFKAMINNELTVHHLSRIAVSKAIDPNGGTYTDNDRYLTTSLDKKMMGQAVPNPKFSASQKEPKMEWRLNQWPAARWSRHAMHRVFDCKFKKNMKTITLNNKRISADIIDSSCKEENSKT